MSRNGGTFRPAELSGPGADFSDTDLAAAHAVARELEAAMPPDSPRPTREFADRVMAAIAAEPAPRAAGFLAGVLRHPGLSSFVASIREAWSVGSAGRGRPVLARGLALSYVLAIVVIGVSLTGAAAFGTAGALGLLDGGRSPSPGVAEPPSTPRSDATSPAESMEPSGLPEASDSAEPSPSSEPDGSDQPGDSGRPPSSRPGPPASDDHKGHPTQTPRPSDDPGRPRPSESLQPGETPP